MSLNKCAAARIPCMRKLLCALFCGSFLLLSGGCRDSKRGSDGSTGVAAEGKVDQETKRLSEAEVVESAKQYARIYFQRDEKVSGESSKKQEEDYFTNGVFKPFAEFDKKLDRWSVSFTDGLNHFDIEMNVDATRGALVASWFDIPDVPRVSATGSDGKRPQLVGLKEFGEAVDRCKKLGR